MPFLNGMSDVDVVVNMDAEKLVCEKDRYGPAAEGERKPDRVDACFCRLPARNGDKTLNQFKIDEHIFHYKVPSQIQSFVPCGLFKIRSKSQGSGWGKTV